VYNDRTLTEKSGCGMRCYPDYMIHLVAGESARGTLEQTSIPGEKLSIDDILMEGPVIDGLRSESAWSERAEYLERFFSIPKADYVSGKPERDRILSESLSHDEIVLWFEFDLFCQANLMYYLDWYASRDLGAARLMLICPETFPGKPNFRGLGELFENELESLFPQRTEVTAEQKHIAQRAWQVFSDEDPRAIERFIRSDTSPLPLVAPAWRAHLERFPSTANGLGVVPQKTLEAIQSQPLPFKKLFHVVNSTPELFRHGMGDLQLQAYLDMLSSGPVPLVQEEGAVEITAAGQAVLQNRLDAIEVNGIDIWYGGVHLTPANVWRWDVGQQEVKKL